jgi:prepilin-type N-terminal cleavage/methylation domain-containing protein
MDHYGPSLALEVASFVHVLSKNLNLPNPVPAWGRTTAKDAFTLIELLVVIAIVPGQLYRAVAAHRNTKARYECSQAKQEPICAYP